MRSGASVAALLSTLTMMENTFASRSLVGRLGFIFALSRVCVVGVPFEFDAIWVWMLTWGCQKVDYLSNDFVTVADLLQVNGLLITLLCVCMC